MASKESETAICANNFEKDLLGDSNSRTREAYEMASKESETGICANNFEKDLLGDTNRIRETYEMASKESETGICANNFEMDLLGDSNSRTRETYEMASKESETGICANNFEKKSDELLVENNNSRIRVTYEMASKESEIEIYANNFEKKSDELLVDNNNSRIRETYEMASEAPEIKIFANNFEKKNDKKEFRAHNSGKLKGTNLKTTEELEMEICFDHFKQIESTVNSHPKKVVLVLGITGSGKTTLVEFLVKSNNKLLSKDISDIGDYVIVDTEGKIGFDVTIVSQTFLTELTVDPGSNVAYADNPGYEDNRRPAIAIATCYSIREIIKNATKIKILLVTNYSSVRKGNDRTDFPALIRHTLKLVKNVEKYKDNIALVVTKVENHRSKEGNLIPDKPIISYIAKYLEKYKTEIDKIAQDQSAEKAKILIEGVLANMRIGIFRRPTEEGPLSEMEILQNEKMVIKQMIKNMEYKTVDQQDFGYAFSDRSQIIIRNMVDVINQNILREVEKIGEVVFQTHETKEVFMRDIYTLYKDVSFAYEKMQNILENMDGHLSFQEFDRKLSDLMGALKIKGCDDRVSNMRKQNGYLQFFDVICEDKLSNYSPLQWKDGLGQSLRYLSCTEKWYKYLIQLLERLSEYDIQRDRFKFKQLCKNEIKSIDDKDLKEFMLTKCPGIYEQIRKLKPSSPKLKVLNRLIHSMLTHTVDCEYRDDSSTYVMRGDYVKLSDIDFKKLQKAKFLEIFAASKIFIDCDLFNTNAGLHQVSIVAPTCEIWEARKIVLNGEDQCSARDDRAEDGISIEEHGEDGLSGEPGQSAGHFLGLVAKVINGPNLTILANGSNGGPGQNGGIGAAGWDGESPTSGKDIKRFRNKYGGSRFFGLIQTYNIYGKNGTNGGNGGDGGVGGKGGYAGIVEILSAAANSGIRICNEQGKDGPSGLGGLGGKEGSGGKHITTDLWFWLWWSSVRTDTSSSASETCSNGQPGKNGIAGRNTTGLRQPERISFIRQTEIIDKYETFLRNKVLPNEKIKYDRILEFLDQLNKTLQRHQPQINDSITSMSVENPHSSSIHNKLGKMGQKLQKKFNDGLYSIGIKRPI